MVESRYPYQPTSPTGALAALGAALALALTLPDAGLRVLMVFIALGPVVWLIKETLLRRCAVHLNKTQVIIEQPLPVFTRAVPYDKITGVLASAEGGQPAIAYRRPPRQPGLRPRLGLVAFAPLEGETAFWDALRARTPDALPFDAAQVARYLRGRQLRRRMLAGALLLLTPFVVIILARIMAIF